MLMAAQSSDRSDKMLSMLESMGGGVLVDAFRRMDVAEEEIVAAKRRCRRKAAKLHNAFQFLCAPHLHRYSLDVYRAHVRELLGRVMRGEALEPGTDAEMLAVFSETSLKAPLESGHAHAMSVVFHRVFPEADPTKTFAGRQSWPTETEEILRDLRKKLSTARKVA